LGCFEEKRLGLLTQLGLTLLQAKVYLAFLASERSTARMAARNSHIARQEVYRVINELLDAGLITKEISKPTKYKPVPFDKFVKFSFEEKRKKLTMLEAGAEEMLQTYINDNDATKALPEEYEFREMLKNDKVFNSVNILLGLKTLDIVNSARRYGQSLLSTDHHEEALRTGTKMRVILENPKIDTLFFKKIMELKKSPFYEIRFVPFEPKVLFGIRDKREIYLVTKPSQPCGPPYLISNHPCFVELAQKYFDVLWLESVKFDEYIKNGRCRIECQPENEDLQLCQNSTKTSEQDAPDFYLKTKSTPLNSTTGHRKRVLKTLKIIAKL
jgi:sugar-specific transcriptional regulator TrmB